MFPYTKPPVGLYVCCRVAGENGFRPFFVSFTRAVDVRRGQAIAHKYQLQVQ